MSDKSDRVQQGGHFCSNARHRKAHHPERFGRKLLLAAAHHPEHFGRKLLLAAAHHPEHFGCKLRLVTTHHPEHFGRRMFPKPNTRNQTDDVTASNIGV